MDDLIVLIGSFCGEDNYNLIESYFKKNITVSNSEYERIMLRGFEKNGKKVVMLSAPAVGKYPFSCKRFFTNILSPASNIVVANYCTFFAFSHSSKYHFLRKEFLKIYKKNQKKNITVVACEAHYPYLKLIKYCKKKLKLKTSLIVPDLPENVISSTSTLYRFFKKRETSKIYKVANNYVDSFLFFTDMMVSKFEVNKKYIVRQGAIEGFTIKHKSSNSRIKCSYVGKVDKENGMIYIYEAARAMPTIDFEVYGSGNMEELFKSNCPPNIRFYGFLNPKKVNEKLLDADVLLSPRLPESYTIYSFPSKVLKYISACKPVVTFKLPCYPDSFEAGLIYPKDLSIEAFCGAIKYALNNMEQYSDACLIYTFQYLLAENVVKDFLSLIIDSEN